MFRRPGKVPHPPRDLAPQKKAPADDLAMIEFLLMEDGFDNSVEVTETVIKCKCHAGNITRNLLNRINSLGVDYRINKEVFIFDRKNPINQLTK